MINKHDLLQAWAVLLSRGILPDVLIPHAQEALNFEMPINDFPQQIRYFFAGGRQELLTLVV